MLTFLKKPHKKEEILQVLNPIVKKWFFSRFKEFSSPQLYCVPEIHERNNILISAPTGGTKTLTAFLSIINELVNLSESNYLQDQIYAIYISPLKALANDIWINLEKPLQEIEKLANKPLGIRVAKRTGDTKPSERQKMLKKVPHIFITTPESLAILLSSYKFRELFKNVQYCIIDEIHSIAENKRGVHLSLSLERLQNISPNMKRIGLSATVSPIKEMANLLTGNRTCKIADISLTKKYNLKVISPLPDLINTTQKKLHNSLYNLLDNLIQKHKTTLIFTNTRAATERVVHHLKEKFPKKYIENIGAHHGSLSKAHRLNIEEKLRNGELKAVVCSTSLELGIDIGYIDLVICLGSPKSVSRFLQRVGRSGHSLHETVKGRIIVLDRDDLVECSVLLKSAIEKQIDKIHIPKNSLDVLAQQIFGMAIVQPWNLNELYKLIKNSYCYKNLTYTDFLEVIKYLAGEYTKLEDRHVYAKIWYDEDTNMIGKRGRLARVLYMTNIGTIPDETAVLVKIKDELIGKIDEAFLERLKRGDIFVLGGNTYQFKFSRGMTAQVQSAYDRAPTVPSWYSDMLPLSFDLSQEISKFRRNLEDLFVNEKSKKEITQYINKTLYVDENASKAIYKYFREQYLYSQIPHLRKILIEFYQDENKKYYIFHSLNGRRVNDVLSRALAYAIAKIQHRDVEVGISDNGFYLASKNPIQALRAFNLLKPEELEQLMKLALEKSEVLKRRFRHCATRALMILRQYKGVKKRVGRQQVSSMILLSAVKRISNDFSILKETRREILEDLMDIKNAKLILQNIKDKKIEIKQVNHTIPSPFAFNLVTQAHTDILKGEEKLEFLQRMHQQVLTKIGKKYEID